ncbi:MAG: AAA family ATPase [Chloroflexi bacterium]|nr:AAA family ATPase [Chloroflexota bacterium]
MATNAAQAPAVDWNIPSTSGGLLNISLEQGNCLFVVGPNGSGKSALIQHLVSSSQSLKIRRMSAHRQTWFNSGGLDLTPARRKQFEQENSQLERQYGALWQDHYAQEKQWAVLFDLIAKDNRLARCIRDLVGKDLQAAKKRFQESVSPFTELNDLLSLGTLLVALENPNDQEILARHRDASEPYSIAQMSDGERNAAMLGATVLTAEAGTVMLIDEPERHLHHSIAVPFLAAVLANRDDCTFIVSTHDLALPAANPQASVLMVRSCGWRNNQASTWDARLLKPEAQIPEELRRAILGSRRKILCIEGTETSLDLPLYNALFPDISVRACGTGTDVRKAVAGIRESYDLHRIEAFGLIDGDGRTPESVHTLRNRGIFALDCYSVESLLYCCDALDAVANWQAKTLERKPNSLRESALQAALTALRENGVAERMAARRCELRVRDQLASKTPDWKTIRDEEWLDFRVPLKSLYTAELAKFKKLLKAESFDELVARYPLKNSRVFDNIAHALEFPRRELYEETLVARVKSSDELADKLRDRIGILELALAGPSSAVSSGTV